MIKINDVLDRVNTKDGLAFYGVTFNSQNFASCPFHTDQTPSFHYNPKTNRCHCFSCGRSGTVIDFVAELFQYNLPKELPKVLEKINEDFNLGLGKPLSETEKMVYKQEQRLTQALKAADSSWKGSLSNNYALWTGVYRTLYHTFVKGGAGNVELGTLLERLENALEDYSGNNLRAWPPQDLSKQQKEWILSTVRLIQMEKEEPPNFKAFCEQEQGRLEPTQNGRVLNENRLISKHGSLEELTKSMEVRPGG